MNEELKARYILALEYAYSKVPEKHRYNDIFYSIVAGKFAELIVRECARISIENEGVWTIQGKQTALEFMEHFGVEE